MFVLVTSRFLSKLPITLIASLLYFFPVSVVCFNVWLKPSIKDNVLLHSMYKSCLLFVLLVLTTKIELSMPVQSLNIDLSNAAICILSCSSAFMKKGVPRFSFLRKGGGRRGEGVSLSFGNVNHPCSAVWVYPVLGTHTSSYRKFIHARPSQ